MRVDRLPQSFTRARNDAVIDPIVGHRGAVHGQPQRVARGACAGPAQPRDTRSMIREIGLEVGHQQYKEVIPAEPVFRTGVLHFLEACP